MSEIPLSYFRASGGPAYAAVLKHHNAWAKAKEQLALLTREFGAIAEVYYRQGPRVLGLRFPPGFKPKCWRIVGPRGHGFLTPSDSLPAVRNRMLAITLPTGEELAHDLHLPAFFRVPQGEYCTAATGFVMGDTAYGTFPRGLKATAVATSPDLTLLRRGPYFEALDVFEDYQP
jgi:hypothetical protein